MKQTLKRWVSLIDEALLKDDKVRPSIETPAPLPAASGPEKPSEEPSLATPPAALLEDLGLTETDNAHLFSAIRSLGRQTSIPVNIHADIYSLITPTYIQIATPRIIEAELLQPFETGAKEITLMFLASKKTIPATIHTIHHTHFFVDTVHSTLCHRPGERLLVLFPALPGKRYVLQAVVDEIYAGRLKLRYQDPRYDVRRQLRLATPVLLRLMPPTVVAAIAQERVRIMRDIRIPAAEAAPPEAGSLADRLYHIDTTIPSPHMHLLENVPALPCGIRDISPGGTCLTLHSEQRPEEMLHRVVVLQIALTDLGSTAHQGQYIPFVLAPFGVIRNLKTAAQPWTLHIRFLKRLPQECGLLFAHLEQQYLETQKPLG